MKHDDDENRREAIEAKIKETDNLLAEANRAGVDPVQAIRDAIDARKR
jgi:hypothetical protein